MKQDSFNPLTPTALELMYSAEFIQNRIEQQKKYLTSYKSTTHSRPDYTTVILSAEYILSRLETSLATILHNPFIMTLEEFSLLILRLSNLYFTKFNHKWPHKEDGDTRKMVTFCMNPLLSFEDTHSLLLSKGFTFSNREVYEGNLYIAYFTPPLIY